LNRPLLIGGALTSAAISIAGAAYVAWRRNRPPTSAMVRAARAVARSRPS
jgi:HAMP domain-containing protein